MIEAPIAVPTPKTIPRMNRAPGLFCFSSAAAVREISFISFALLSLSEFVIMQSVFFNKDTLPSLCLKMHSGL